jgi:hypothetical protein
MHDWTRFEGFEGFEVQNAISIAWDSITFAEALPNTTSVIYQLHGWTLFRVYIFNGILDGILVTGLDKTVKLCKCARDLLPQFL